MSIEIDLSDGVSARRGQAEIVFDKGPPRTVFEKDKVQQVCIPSHEHPVCVVARLIELLHAQRSPPHDDGIVSRAVEGVVICGHEWHKAAPCPATQADARHTAREGMKFAGEFTADKRNQSLWNGLVAHCAQMLSLAQGSGADAQTLLYGQRKLYEVFRKYKGAREKIKQAVAYGRMNNRAQVRAIMKELLFPDADDGGKSFDWKPLLPESLNVKCSDPMKIIDLDRTHPCSLSRDNEREELVSSGLRMVMSRVPRAIASKSSHGLYRRDFPREFCGAVLIDASGSMHLTSAQLNAICEAASGFKVAYYDGHDNMAGYLHSKVWGFLVIYAKDGWRATSSPRYGSGGNGVDLYALRWLLAQPGPKYFVTDGGFCSGPENQDQKAKQLLAQVADQVTLFHNVDQAKSFFEKLDLEE